MQDAWLYEGKSAVIGMYLLGEEIPGRFIDPSLRLPQITRFCSYFCYGH